MKLPVPLSGIPRAALPLTAIAIAFVSGGLFGVEIGLLVGACGALALVIAAGAAALVGLE